jgi:hypothetical protein
VLRRSRAFGAWVATLPVPFHLVHLDERSENVAAASEGRTPCVLARTSDGLVVVLDANRLASCHGDPARLGEEIDHAVATLHLRWPT